MTREKNEKKMYIYVKTSNAIIRKKKGKRKEKKKTKNTHMFKLVKKRKKNVHIRTD